MCARRSMPALPSSRFLSRHGRVERRRARTKTITTNHRRPRFLGLFFQFLSTHLGVNFDHKKPERISSSAGSAENKQQELIKKCRQREGCGRWRRVHSPCAHLAKLKDTMELFFQFPSNYSGAIVKRQEQQQQTRCARSADILWVFTKK